MEGEEKQSGPAALATTQVAKKIKLQGHQAALLKCQLSKVAPWPWILRRIPRARMSLKAIRKRTLTARWTERRSNRGAARRILSQHSHKVSRRRRRATK